MIFICIYLPSLWTFTCFGGALCLIVYAPESHTLSNYRVRLVSGKKKKPFNKGQYQILLPNYLPFCMSKLKHLFIDTSQFHLNYRHANICFVNLFLLQVYCILCRGSRTMYILYMPVYTIHLFGLLPVLEGPSVWLFMCPSHTHSVTTESDWYPGRRRSLSTRGSITQIFVL
jgi:hypothetical protein